MKKLIISFILLTAILFAQSEIKLTGEFANNNGNPFKRVLNTKKLGSINYKNIDKDLVLKVETNLKEDFITSSIQKDDSFIITKIDLNKILKQYLSEDYLINKTGKLFAINFKSGLIKIKYTNPKSNRGTHTILKIEITLNYTLIKGDTTKNKSITLDHTLGITGDNYDWAISTEKDLFWRGLETNIQRIIETELFIIINKEG